MSKTTHIIEHDVHTIIEEEDREEVGARTGKRRRLFTALAATVAVLGGGYYAYDVLVASQHVETDNAYVGANVAQVTPLVGGPVLDVLVDDTQSVRRGDILVRLDNTDAKITLARAEAELATTIRKVRGLVATDSGLGAQIAARVAEQASVEAQLALLQKS